MTFTLAHLSDPHIGPLPRIPFRELLNKRLTGALNWHSARATIHNMDVLAAIMGDILQQAPDHIALTGDLVNIGHENEFPQALSTTEILGGPDRVSIVPGNHDAYIRESLPAMAAVFSPFMSGDDTEQHAFPYLRQRGAIALIGVNSGIPTLPFMATGKVGRAQRQALADMLDVTRKAGLFRVVMIHHPPVKNASRFGRSLKDNKEFTRMLAEHGAELVLHGHNHRHSLNVIESRTGPVPVVGVGSASAVPGTPLHKAEYHLIRIDPEMRSFELRRRGFAGRNSQIDDLGGFCFPVIPVPGTKP